MTGSGAVMLMAGKVKTVGTFRSSSDSNPGRAGHKMALAAERALDDTRHLLNQLFHGEAPERFAFTLNGSPVLIGNFFF